MCVLKVWLKVHRSNHFSLLERLYWLVLDFHANMVWCLNLCLNFVTKDFFCLMIYLWSMASLSGILCVLLLGTTLFILEIKEMTETRYFFLDAVTKGAARGTNSWQIAVPRTPAGLLTLDCQRGPWWPCNCMIPKKFLLSLSQSWSEAANMNTNNRLAKPGHRD